MIGSWLKRLVVPALLAVITNSTATATPPATKYWEGEHLEQVRLAPADQPLLVRQALGQLARKADEALRRGPYTVVNKRSFPPSGDKHDYVSFGRYWWPNPDTPDGLPYVRRDGRVNKALLDRGDRNRIGNFYNDFESLSLAAYLIDEDRYASHAITLLRTWFLLPETRMTPHLKYGQGVPGKADGRAPGILDTRDFIGVLDGIALLDNLGQLNPDDMHGLQQWFEDYLAWLITSDLGKHERLVPNNHGDWFAAQALRIAMFVDNRSLTEELLEETKTFRIAASIDADGLMTEEITRTRLLHYSLFSLTALCAAARLGEDQGFDLWNYQTESGISLALALNCIVPYAIDQESWPYPHIAKFALSEEQSPLFYLASTRLHDAKYVQYMDQMPQRFSDRYYTPLLFKSPSLDEE